MTLLDFVPCIEALAIAAILPAAAVLLLIYFGRRKRHRLEVWRSLGLSPETGTWQVLWAWDSLVGEYRGRKITMSWGSFVDELQGVLVKRDKRRTRVKVAVRCPPETHLIIRPKRKADLSAWLGRRDRIQVHDLEDQFALQAYPFDLAMRILEFPDLSIPLMTAPESGIKLIGDQLQFEWHGYFPDPQDSVVLFDKLCNLADLIEQITSYSVGYGQLTGSD